jgi:hypothetical protein
MKRRVYLALLAVIAPFVLVGCGLLPLSAAEKSYVEDCKKVQLNLDKYMKIQDQFYKAEYDDPRYGWQTWPESYAVTNAGEESRVSASRSVKSNFPWIYAIARDNLQSKTKKEFLAQDISSWSGGKLEQELLEGFYQLLAAGSSFNVTIDTLKRIDSDFYSLEFNNVFGTFAPSERFKNCDDALGLKEEESFESLASDYSFYGSTGVDLRSVLDVSIGLWGCETFGAGYVDYGKGWTNCANADFEDTYVYTPSTELTEEEKEILAEREADAEREALNPSGSSGYSNVTPLQLCSSLGAVVQTENYGQLTCKYVFINRVRALAWMR